MWPGLSARRVLPGSREQEQAFSLPGKTEAMRGPAPGKNRVRARRRERKDRVRDLPGAAARACETRRRKRQGERLARRSRAGVRDAAKEKTGRATCSAQPRGRARRGEGKDRESDLLGAAARACEAGRKHKHGACLAHRRCVNSGCGLRRWCAGSRGPCGCRACRGTRRKPS